MHKTKIPKDKVKIFIEGKFGAEVEAEEIESGEFSQAFGIKFDNKNLILRFNSNNDLGFQKDKIIADKFPHINSANIIENGTFEGVFFSISERLDGISIRELKVKANKKILSSLFKNMNLIHTSKFNAVGFGNWNLTLTGQFIDWKERLHLYLEKETWETLKTTSTFFDIDLVKKLESKYLSLSKFALNKRYFLHGDFGRSNIFSDTETITGIIDWSEAMYGDFLWDLSWLDFWVDSIDYIDEYYKFNKDNKDLDLTNFTERTNLYTIVAGVHNMLFAVKRNDKETYQDVVKIIERKVK